MNTGLIIFEKDDYFYRLLKSRLSDVMPDAFIIRGGPGWMQKLPYVEEFIFMYNSRQYEKGYIDAYKDECDMPISSFAYMESLPVDVRRMAGSSGIQEAERKASKDGSVVVLFPFSYIEEREELIRTDLSYLSDMELQCLRLDLMSGIRMPRGNRVRGLTRALNLAAGGKLDEQGVLSLIQPSEGGFLTLGRPDHTDDVFDSGMNAVKGLIAQTVKLKQGAVPMNTLIVAEGFRSFEMSEIANLCDEVHFLLPEGLYEDDPVFKDDIGEITRNIRADIPVIKHLSGKYGRVGLYENKI